MKDWKKYYFKIEEALGLVLMVLFGLGGLALTIATFGFAGTVLLSVCFAAAIVLAVWILCS